MTSLEPNIYVSVSFARQLLLEDDPRTLGAAVRWGVCVGGGGQEQEPVNISQANSFLYLTSHLCPTTVYLTVSALLIEERIPKE